ncbi:hypothetical protein [Piscinibacter sp.]|jgi:hypothetical protein|uniref:hypothetical protein n=1 Tax=Piscinibacter sp. TaxID=1903157 RepID=UPI001D9B76FE|nr:hypothetical protein [Piscinibacter sp.]MBK7532293.1 hypothetical protein [Piscinibacter sp.]
MNNQTTSAPSDASMLETREFVLDVAVFEDGQTHRAGRSHTPVVVTVRVDRISGLVCDFELRVGSPQSECGNEQLASNEETTRGHEATKTAGAPCVIPAQVLDKAKLRDLYIKAGLAVPPTREELRQVAQTMWKVLGKPERPPHWTTVRRWSERYLVGGSDFSAPVRQRRKRLLNNSEQQLGTERG